MNTKWYKYIILFVLTSLAIPMVAQDCMKIYFKDGTRRKFYLSDVTEIVTSKFDADGIQHDDYEYQHVKTLQNNYVYALNDVDSISFTKYNEEFVRENIELAMPEVFKLLSDCKSIADVEGKVSSFKDAKGVEDAWCDGDKLYVKISGLEPMAFNFNHEEEIETKETAIQLSKIRSWLPVLKETVSNNGERIKAIIANQRYNSTFDLFNDFDKLEKEFILCNVDANYIREASLDFYLYDIYDYDLIFLYTHGGYYWGQHWLLTSEELGTGFSLEAATPPSDFSDKILKGRDEIIAKYKKKKINLVDGQDIDIQWSNKYASPIWHAYIAVSENCIKEKSKGSFRSPNSIMFNGACLSLAGNSLAAVFLDKIRGLGAYLGYDNNTCGSATAGYDFFSSLLMGKSFTKSYYDIPYRYRDEKLLLGTLGVVYGAKLGTISRQSEAERISSLFLFPTHTNEISNTTANDQYRERGYIEVEGVAITINPDEIKLGFVYGTEENEENLVAEKQLTDVELISISPTNENGKYLFKGKLTNLEPKNTYHYRAYTFDGLYYNYGKPYSFTLYPDLQVAAQKLELEKGEKFSFTITAGSGEYSVESSDKSVAKANVVGNEVYIEAVSEGKEATITVTDTKSGQKATVTVIVISYGPPLSVGDSFIADGVTYMVTSIKPLEVQMGNSEEGSGVGSAFEWYMESETGHFTIPSKVKGTDGKIYSVTRLGRFSFGECSFTSVDIPNSVTSIGEMAFFGCSGLTSIKIPESVTSIEDHAFYECSGLTSIKIPESVISIGSFAFSKCSSLYSIIIPKNVNSFGYFAFYDCSYLHTVIVLCSPTNIDMGSKQLFKDCNNITEAVFDCSTVTPILCDQTSLKRVTLKGSVTTIGEKAFQGCSSLNTITIPNTVTIIGDNAFRSCRGLTSIVIPNSVTSVGKEAFCGCSGLTSVTISTSVSSIGENTFMNCTSLTSVAIPSSVTELVGGAFANCSGLSSVTIPTSVNSIGVSAFKNCTGLNSVTIPNSVTSIGSYAFMGCSGLTSLTLSKRLTTIGREAFRGCTRLTSVIIPNGVTIVSGGMFSDCTNLVSVYIPSSVSSINWYAFGGCNRLTTVKVNIDNPLYIEKTVFSNSANATLYVPKGCVDIYSQKSGWSDFKTIKEMN